LNCSCVQASSSNGGKPAFSMVAAAPLHHLEFKTSTSILISDGAIGSEMESSLTISTGSRGRRTGLVLDVEGRADQGSSEQRRHCG
jgi:hypothetical protein